MIEERADRAQKVVKIPMADSLHLVLLMLLFIV
jgi:hypothetical protein